GEAELFVDSFFRVSREARVVRHAEEPVLVELQPALNRPVPQRDVVRFRTGEILLRGADALRRHQAKIRLESAREENARFRLAAREHTLDETVAREGFHE